MKVEGEINNFILVWSIAVVSLCYCHTIGKLIPKGPLSTNPSLSLRHFIPIACLPIKIQQNPLSQIGNKENPLSQNGNKENPSLHFFKKGRKSPLNYATKALILAAFVPIYENRGNVHPKLILLLYSFHVYIGLEIAMALVAAGARALLGVELEPQFDEPYLSTSLQDFWGRRWNLMVSNILRPTVYNPVLTRSSAVVGRKWAPIPAMLTTFFVSGVMHELIFYYLGREKPTGELMWFFSFHGVCLAIEVAIKKALKGSKWWLPPIVSRPLTVVFVLSTGVRWFLPSLVWCKADEKARIESIAFVEFLTNVYEALKYVCLHLFYFISAAKHNLG
ncbi:Acyl-CoA--sterol O-acyltransferase 1 [Quillaja saponaria]|uniref:Acyl-CoA--sterol O-acyltransferase 1 n=1 Tax=Quillaja saponaria TaxID=32244 RepID=A0AAD7PUD9_QUISA|nr:Acyl-CoA--sterol O-acyltransferase 1 [Quillaja saponaria]